MTQPKTFTHLPDALRHAVEVGIVGITECDDLLLADGTTLGLEVGVSCGSYCYGGSVDLQCSTWESYEWERKGATWAKKPALPHPARCSVCGWGEADCICG